MVAQKKGGAGKQKGNKVTPGRQQPVKMFETKFGDDDDDDVETGSDSGSESNEAPASAKKTPMKSPAPKSAKKDMHVSFQLQGKTTPNANQKQQMQKARTPTPMVPKKQQAQLLREQCLKKGMTGSPTLKAFEGMKGSPQKNQAQKGMKRKSEEGDDDDEDDDDFEDEDDDDIDLDDEDDDQDSDKEGDDDEDDDDELDSDEEEEILEKAKAMLGKKNLSKTPVKQNDSVNAKKVNEPPSAKKQNQLQTPKKQQNNQATKDAKTPQQKSAAKSPEKPSALNVAAVSMDEQTRNARDLKSLFVKSFPFGTSQEEIKTLSPDILGVRFPNRFKKEGKAKGKGIYVFLEFASEEKAEENYKLLQKKKFRGESLMVDFAGTKSKIVRTPNENQSKNFKKLFVEGMTSNTTIGDVANLFPKAYWIMMSESTDLRTASVLFRKDEDAAEAMKKNTNVTINGRAVSILFAVDGKRKQKKRPNKSQRKNKNAQPQLKKQKVEEPESDDDDDDDDDED